MYNHLFTCQSAQSAHWLDQPEAFGPSGPGQVFFWRGVTKKYFVGFLVSFTSIPSWDLCRKSLRLGNRDFLQWIRNFAGCTNNCVPRRPKLNAIKVTEIAICKRLVLVPGPRWFTNLVAMPSVGTPTGPPLTGRLQIFLDSVFSLKIFLWVASQNVVYLEPVVIWPVPSFV